MNGSPRFNELLSQLEPLAAEKGIGVKRYVKEILQKHIHAHRDELQRIHQARQQAELVETSPTNAPAAIGTSDAPLGVTDGEKKLSVPSQLQPDEQGHKPAQSSAMEIDPKRNEVETALKEYLEGLAVTIVPHNQKSLDQFCRFVRNECRKLRAASPVGIRQDRDELLQRAVRQAAGIPAFTRPDEPIWLLPARPIVTGLLKEHRKHLTPPDVFARELIAAYAAGKCLLSIEDIVKGCDDIDAREPNRTVWNSPHFTNTAMLSLLKECGYNTETIPPKALTVLNNKLTLRMQSWGPGPLQRENLMAELKNEITAMGGMNGLSKKLEGREKDGWDGTDKVPDNVIIASIPAEYTGSDLTRDQMRFVGGVLSVLGKWGFGYRLIKRSDVEDAVREFLENPQQHLVSRVDHSPIPRKGRRVPRFSEGRKKTTGG